MYLFTLKVQLSLWKTVPHKSSVHHQLTTVVLKLMLIGRATLQFKARQIQKGKKKLSARVILPLLLLRQILLFFFFFLNQPWVTYTGDFSHTLEKASKQFPVYHALVFETKFSAVSLYTYSVCCSNQQRAFSICLPGVCIWLQHSCSI